MSAQNPLSPRQLTWLLASITAITPFATDVYLPAVPVIAEQFQVGTASVQQNLSVFLFGQAIGLLIGGSLSDIYGRKPILLIGLAIFAVCSLLISFVTTLEWFLIMRAVQAIGGGILATMSGAIVKDYYDGQQSAQMFATISLIMMIAPLSAPSIGSLLHHWFGWQSIFVFLACYASAVFILQSCFLPQSNFSNAQRSYRQLVQDTIERYRLVFRTRPALGFLFVQSFSIASMFCFLMESPFIYLQYFSLSEHHYAWLFALNLLIMMAFNRITAWHLKRNVPPHKILTVGVSVQWLVNLTLVLLVCFSSPPLWLFAGLVALSVGSQGLIGPNTQTRFMSFFSTVNGSASGVLLFVQAIIAGVVGYLVSQLHDGTLLIMPMVMLSCTTLGVMLLWFFSRSVWQNSDDVEKIESH